MVAVRKRCWWWSNGGESYVSYEGPLMIGGDCTDCVWMVPGCYVDEI